MHGMRRRRVVVGLVALALGRAAWAQPAATAPVPPELGADLPGARLQGSARMRFLGLQIYDARLWVGPRPVATDWATLPFAIELLYARALDGAQIAERSLTEMRRQGTIDETTAERWLGTMKALFPDVKPGDRITVLNLPGVGARFFVNGSLRGEAREPDFARVFFGIWLSPRSSEPTLRNDLLGSAKP